MGSARKSVSNTKKHLTKSEVAEKEFVESLITGNNDEIVAPKIVKMDKVALKEWKRLVNNLLEMNLVCNLDLNNLVSYVLSYSKYMKITEALIDAPLLVDKVANGTKTQVANPLFNLQVKMAEECRKFGRLIFLDPNTRYKQAEVKASEIGSKIESDFGDI